MDYIKQVEKVKVTTVTEPRIYLTWEDTEPGRDKKQCYERVNNSFVYYVNTYNQNTRVLKGDPFFEVLEEMYNTRISGITGELMCHLCDDEELNGWSSHCKNCNAPIVY